MPSLSHTCQTCGMDLTRLAAPLDPIYGLPVVLCPHCRSACVRRSDGHRAVPREWSRTVRTLRQAIGRFQMYIAAIGLAIAAAVQFSESAHESGRTPWSMLQMLISRQPAQSLEDWTDGDGLFFFVIAFMFAAASGAFIGVASPPRRRALLLCCTLAAAAVLTVVPQTGEFVSQLARGVNAPSMLLDADAMSRMYVHEARYLSGFVLAGPIMLAGLLLGLPLLRIRTHWTRTQWRRRRRRLRARRQNS